MGLRYSKSVVATIDTKELGLDGLDIIFLRSKIIGLSRNYKKNGVYFLEKAELQWAFQFTEKQVYRCMSMFDPSGSMKVPCLDLWGALCLTGTDSVQDKMDFCFKLMDLNNDNCMNFNDMYVLFMCITRGITRFRGYAAISSDYIHKLVMLIFQANAKLLKNGEISMKDFRVYILTNELVRTYLSSLGTKIPPVDTAAIVVKRSNLQLEAANCKAEIARVMCEIAEINEDWDAFLKERGGDASLLKMTSSEVNSTAPAPITAAAVSAGSSRPPTTASSSHHSGRGGGTPAMPDNVVTRAIAAAANSAGSVTLADAPKNSKASLVASLRLLTKPAPFSFSSPMHTAEELHRLLGVEDAASHIPADHWSSKYFHKEELDSDEEEQARDIAAFKAAGAARNLFGDNFKSTLFLLWCKLPHDEDHLCRLDEYALMALFDSVGIPLSHYHAALCLKTLKTNQIHRYCFEDVLRWYRLYGSSAEALLVRNRSTYLPNTYEGVHADLFAWWQQVSDSLQQMSVTFAAQRRALNHISELDPNAANKYPPVHGTAAHLMPSAANTGGSGAANTTAVGISAGAAVGQTTSTSGMSLNRDQNINLKWVDFRAQNLKKPSVLMLKYYFGHPEVIPIDPAAAEAAAIEAAAAASALGGKKGKAAAAAAKKKAEAYQPKFKTVKIEDINDWRMRVNLSITSNPFTNLSTKRPKDMSRIKLRTQNPLNWELNDAAVLDYIEDFPNLQAQDLLDFMNLRLEAEYSERVRSRSSQLAEELEGLNLNLPRKQQQSEEPGYRPVAAVSWFCIELRQRMHYEQELMLIQCIKNYFSSIPFHLRKGWFTSVFAHGFYVYNGDYKSEMKAAAKRGAGGMIAMMKQYMKSQENEETAFNEEQDEYFNSLQRRVVLVALFNESDPLMEVEKTLVESDVFISRTIIRMNLEFNNKETLSELFDKSRQFDHYEDKLFGPQESELGEEGMNPLKFAKSVRQTRKSISETMEKLLNKTLTREEVNGLCRLYGCRDSGSLLEVSEVLLKCLQVQLELVGHGELSQFGKELIERIFHKYKASPESKGDFRKPTEIAAAAAAGAAGAAGDASKDVDSGLLLWEFNKLLADANCCTIFDQKEYRTIMSEIQVLLDKSGNMKQEGLMNYYCNYGRIAADNNLIGIGSLDEWLKGKLIFNCTYESDALASLLSLIGKNSVLSGLLPKYIAWLCGVRDVKVDGELDHLSELLEMLRYLVIEPDFGFDANSSSSSSSSSSSISSASSSNKAFNPFDDLHRLLKTPGYLSSTINRLSEFLADGEDGVIPSMRKRCRELFGTKTNNNSAADNNSNNTNDGDSGNSDSGSGWDEWEAVFTDQLLHRVKSEVSAVEEGIRQQMLAEAVRQLKERLEVERLGMTAAISDTAAATAAGSADRKANNAGNNTNKKKKKRVTIEESDKVSVGTLDTAPSFLDVTAVEATATAATANTNSSGNDDVNSLATGNSSNPHDNDDDSDADSLIDYEAEAAAEAAREEAKLTAAAALEVKADSPFVVKTRKDNLIKQLVSEALPPLAEGNDADLVGELMQLKEDLIFLSDLVNQPHLDLTLSESKLIVQKKVSSLRRIDEIQAMLREIEQRQVAHSCAAYDALRLFGRGLASLGSGTKDFCVRGNTEGVNILDYLPRGMGEFAPAKQEYKEKVERAQARKEAALAALERERIRRNMTEEEKEAIRQEQLAAQRRVWELEEAELYRVACGALFDAREERKSSAELSAMVKQWEDLMALKESRHPDSLQVAVCQSNLACILLEFYGMDHPLGAGSVYIFQSAVEMLMKPLKGVAERWKNAPLSLMDEPHSVAAATAAAHSGGYSRAATAATTAEGKKKRVRIEGESGVDGDDTSSIGNNSQVTADLAAAAEAPQQSNAHVSAGPMSVDDLLKAEEEEEEQEQTIQMFNNQQLVTDTSNAAIDEAALLEPLQVVPTVVLLANYLTTLVEADNFTLLKQSFDLKVFTYQLLSLLDKDRERERLLRGVINTVVGMDVFYCKKPSAALEPIIAEVEAHIQELRAREEAERLREELELASQSLRDDESSTVTSVKLTKAQQKKQHQEQRAQQRRRDTIKRFETSQQRNMLYELIRTDKITKIFNIKSNAVMLADAPKWGSTSDLMLDASADLATLARTMSQPQFDVPADEGNSDSDDSDSISSKGFTATSKKSTKKSGDGSSSVSSSKTEKASAAAGAAAGAAGSVSDAAASGVSGRPDSPTRKVTDYRTMAMLDQVQLGSPSHRAGVMDGDVLIQFGHINRSVPDCIAGISVLVQQSVGQWIPVVVRRDDELIHLQLQPSEWGGRGLLGCRVTPFTSNRVKLMAVERSSREGNSNSSSGNSARQSPVRRGMTIIDEILDGSPAAAAGLEEGDVLVEFGSVSRSTPNYLKAIGFVAGESLHEPVNLVIKRAGEFIDLTITPSEWGGRGVLGCRLTPIP